LKNFEAYKQERYWRYVMTVKECYEKMGSNYENVLERLGNENIIKKFAIKFLDDASFSNLTIALNEENAEEAFRAIHTLKGICLNLGFDKLYEVSAELTEKLRDCRIENVDADYEKVKKYYEITVDAIRGIQL
jgi:histidine phosphotransfer protein HptB